MIGAVATHLQNLQWEGFNEATLSSMTQEANCLLGTSIQSTSLCTYTYVASGASIGVSLILVLLSCTACKCCGCGGMLDALLGGLAAVWWAIAGGVLTANGVRANDAGWPAESWRISVFASAWVEAGLFAVAVIVHMFCSDHVTDEPDVADARARRRSEQSRSQILRDQRSVYAQFQTKPNSYKAFKPEISPNAATRV